MKTAVFLSYNSITGFSAGWVNGDTDCRALVIPCLHGSAARGQEESGGDVTREIDKLLGQLQENLNKVDHIVIYVGAKGAERAITLTKGIPTAKIVFVMCDCLLFRKHALLESAGHTRPQTIDCECRGLDTMGMLARRFLRTGKITTQ